MSSPVYPKQAGFFIAHMGTTIRSHLASEREIRTQQFCLLLDKCPKISEGKKTLPKTHGGK